MKTQGALVVALAWGIIALATFATAWPQIDTLGLYYDEAFLAQQARDFVEPERAAVHPPSVTTTFIAGRPFPLRNAAYLGSLKSQLTIPSLALFGSSPAVLRLTTLGIGLLALLFCMLWIERIWGRDIAIVTGLLVASDPSFHFFAQFEWGPFTSMLLCRGAGLYLLCVAVQTQRSLVRWFAWLVGSACFGLGIYSRVDFAVVLAGLGLSLLLLRRDLVTRVVRDQRGQMIAGAFVFLLCVSPVVAVVGDVLGAGTGIADRGDFGYRVRVLSSVLDGSHFYRLIETGGLFDDLFRADAPATAFAGLAFAGSIALLLPTLRNRLNAFALVATVSIAAAMLAIPGAVRAHHMLNAMPFAHLVVAIAGVSLWRRNWSSERRRKLARACVALAALAHTAATLSTISETHALIRDTGGTGRWSATLGDFAREIDASPDAAQMRIVSLDWGFYEPLVFTTRNVALSEPIWAMGDLLQRHNRWVANGDADTIYLFHEPPYDLFGFGGPFAQMLRIHADRAEISEHRDGRGGLVFKSVRFDAPHELSFDGSFRLRLREVDR